MSDELWKNRIEKKLDEVVLRNNSQDKHLAELTTIAEVNAEVLKEHKKASEGNGKRIKIMEDELLTHLNYVKGWLRAIKWILGLPASILGLVSLVLGIMYTLSKFN